jgi:hypothetical protein
MRLVTTSNSSGGSFSPAVAVRQRADKLRENYLHLRPGEPNADGLVNVVSVFENISAINLGLPVRLRPEVVPLGDRVEGMTLPDGRIQVNSGTFNRAVFHSSPRAIHAIAHELGHAVLEHPRTLGQPTARKSLLEGILFNRPKDRNIVAAEWEADEFARCLMMPSEFLAATRMRVESALFPPSNRCKGRRLRPKPESHEASLYVIQEANEVVLALIDEVKKHCFVLPEHARIRVATWIRFESGCFPSRDSAAIGSFHWLRRNDVLLETEVAVDPREKVKNKPR